MQVGFAVFARLPRRHDQRQRRTEHQEDRESHRQQHVADHVHRERRRDDHADARTHDHCQAQRTQQEPGGAARRPRMPGATSTTHRIQVADGEQNAECTEHDVETPNGPDIEDVRFERDVVADGDFHRRQVRIVRCRWRGAAHGDGDASGQCHHQHFDNSDALEYDWALCQLRDAAGAVQTTQSHEDEVLAVMIQP